MKLLLDTHVLLWSVLDSSKLSPSATVHLTDPGNEVFISAVSSWEIAIKHSLGKLDLNNITPADFLTYATDRVGFSLLEMDNRLAITYGSVPALHPDPFDRMLIHQAMSLDMFMVSADKRFSAYEKHGLKLIW